MTDFSEDVKSELKRREESLPYLRGANSLTLAAVLGLWY